jgi:hypothetical protein
MFFPDVINYLLTLRYPGSETGKTNWVCYRGGWQVVIPFVPPGTTIPFTIKPLHGSYAWLAYATSFGTDIVPNMFTGTISQYGTTPYSGLLTQRIRDDTFEYFILVTEQEPTYLSVTNISPLGQRGECIGNFLVIPTPQDLVTVTDALRRLHTSTVSEQLLQQVVYLLGVLSGQPQTPRPPVGGP